MKVKVVLCSLLSLFSSSLFAAPVTAPGWQRPAVQPPAAAEAAAVVRGGMEALVKFLDGDRRPDQTRMAAFMREQVASRFDFERMSGLAMGRAFGRLEERQRAKLAQNIQQDFLRHLTARLAGFKDQRVRFFRPRPAGMNQAVVTVGIANARGYPARLDFRLYRSADGWKVYDVVANGNSAVSYYRQKFASAWRRQYTHLGGYR